MPRGAVPADQNGAGAEEKWHELRNSSAPMKEGKEAIFLKGI